MVLSKPDNHGWGLLWRASGSRESGSRFTRTLRMQDAVIPEKREHVRRALLLITYPAILQLPVPVPGAPGMD